MLSGMPACLGKLTQPTPRADSANVQRKIDCGADGLGLEKVRVMSHRDGQPCSLSQILACRLALLWGVSLIFPRLGGFV